MERKCTKCQATKPLTEFWLRKEGRYGRQSVCADCKSSKVEVAKARFLAAFPHFAWCGRGLHFAYRSAFNKASHRKNGLSSLCRQCKSMEYQSNKDVVLQKQKEYRQNFPEIGRKSSARWQRENRDRSRKIKARYRENHPDKIVAGSRDRYSKKADQINAVNKIWRQRNKSKVQTFVRNRRSLLSGASGRFTDEQWKAKLEYFGNRCYLCRSSFTQTPTIEHRIPLSRGGSNWIANIAPACSTCNSSKGTRTEAEFRRDALVNLSKNF